MENIPNQNAWRLSNAERVALNLSSGEIIWPYTRANELAELIMRGREHLGLTTSREATHFQSRVLDAMVGQLSPYLEDVINDDADAFLRGLTQD